MRQFTSLETALRTLSFHPSNLVNTCDGPTSFLCENDFGSICRWTITPDKYSLIRSDEWDDSMAIPEVL